MPNAPTARTLRKTIAPRLARSQSDDVEFESLRADAIECVRFVRRDLDRAFAFAEQELQSEMLSVVEDHPDLVREVEALVELAASVPEFVAILSAKDAVEVGARLPDHDELDRLAACAAMDGRAQELTDALRVAVLRREPLAARIRILRRLRDHQPRRGIWLRQLEQHEQEFLRELADLRSRTVSLEELEQAIGLIDQHNWVTRVPRGLREELLSKARPMRGQQAEQRYLALVEQIHAASSMMDRRALLDLEARWAEVYESTGVMPSAEQQALVDPAFAWLTAQADEEDAAAAFQRKVEALELAVDRGTPAEAIARCLAEVVDGGRAAPDGLVERARAVLAQSEARRRRRGRMIVFASISAAAILCIVGLAAIRAYGSASQTEREIAQLEDLLRSGDVVRAHALAQEIRLGGEVGDARLAALLAEEADLHDRRIARIEAIRASVARIEAELGSDAGVSRARLEALEDELSSLLGGAEESERSAILALESSRSAALGRLDASDAQIVEQGISAVEAALRPWPPLSVWTDAQLVAGDRLMTYGRVLDAQKAALESLLTQITGSRAGDGRVRKQLETIDGRIVELGDSMRALEDALQALEPRSLGAPFRGEREFLDRLTRLVERHGVVLARMGLLAEFEASRDLGTGWTAVEAWREEYRPRLAALIGPALAGEPSLEDQPRVASAIGEFLRAHPKAPNRGALERLAATYDASIATDRWNAAAFVEALEQPRYANLEVVLVQGGRRYYRRPNDPNEVDDSKRNPLYRSLKSKADLFADPSTLPSITPHASRTQLESAPRIDPVSKAWTRALELMRVARSGEEAGHVLEALGAIASQSESDPLFRLHALRDLSDLCVRSGCCSREVATQLTRWLDSLRTAALNSLSVDWVLAAYREPSMFDAARREAVAVLAAFPDVGAAVEKARAARDAERESLAAFVPVGILLRPSSGGAQRMLHGSEYSGPAVLLQRVGGEFRFETVAFERGRLVGSEQVGSTGPTIVFRKDG